MKWKGFEYFAFSDKNYHVSKNLVGLDMWAYIAYGPDKKMLDAPAFYSFREARLECEKHYNEKNKQTEEDEF